MRALFSTAGIRLVAAVWSLALAGVATGQSGDEAQQWFEQGEKAWAEAVELDRAQAGDEADAEKEDEVVPQPDFAGAFALLKKAAEAGHAKAALRVSELLLQGDGVPKDTIGAFEWSQKAAQAGDLEAQLLAASKFEEGRGTTKSLSQALALYEQALEQGSAVARLKVAGLLDRGEPGVEQNRARALPLFQEAAKGGAAEAIYMIGLYLQRGYVVAKDEAAASQWFLRAAEIGEPEAQRKLGLRFFRGTGVSQDPLEALMWCELAIQNPAGGAETKNLAREYKEAIASQLTPRKVEQAMRRVGRFKLKIFEDILLPPMPYSGPPLVFHLLTDTAGNQLEAAILGVEGDTVLLEKRSDGKQVPVLLERLSAESRKLVEGLE